MTTSAADAPLARVLGNFTDIPVIQADIIYEGSMVGESAGYARPLNAGDKFLGHCVEIADNSSGSNGDINVRVLTGRYRLTVTLAGKVTDVGQPVYASDDATLSFSQAAGNSYVGVVTRYISTTELEVEFRTAEQDEFGTRKRVTKTGDYTLLIGENGEVVELSTDAKTITLLATQPGYEVVIVNRGADGTAGIIVDPNASDKFLGGSGIAASADGKAMTNTKATQKRGDYLHLRADGTNGWLIMGYRGTWAAEE